MASIRKKSARARWAPGRAVRRALPLLVVFCNSSCAGSQEDTVLTLPVHVYRYSFEAAPQMSSELSEDSIDEIFERVNHEWSKAGIHWDRLATEDRTIPRDQFSGPATDRTEVREQLQAIAPRDVPEGHWKVVLIREFPVPAGGIYLPPAQTVYFADWTRGGPTSATILAHELGHSLGLTHQTSSSNLMNPRAGGRDIPEQDAEDLTADQIETARSGAARGPSSDAATRPSSDGPDTARSGQANAATRKARVANRLRSFDFDHDGIILMEDVPAPGQKAFRRIDRNGDGRLTEKELAAFED